MAKRRKRSAISFLANGEELRLLKSILYLEPALIDGVEGARRLKSGKYKVKFSPYDLEDALNALSFAAAYTHYREKVKLSSLHDRIKGYLLLSKNLRKTVQKENQTFDRRNQEFL